MISPIAGSPMVLVWAKPTWRCGEAEFERGTWLETSPQVGVSVRCREGCAS